MTIDDILQLPVQDQIKLLQVRPDIPDYTELEQQYDPSQHDVFDIIARPSKSVRRGTGAVDSYGNEIYETTTEGVNRIAIPFQRLIVERAVGFLLGNPVRVKSSAENAAQEQLTSMIERTLEDNKSKYFDRKLARTVMSQCEAAELWYLVEDPSFWGRTLKGSQLSHRYKLRVKLLSPSSGDTLYPYFDTTGDMVAFSRSYSVTSAEGKATEHFDTWTDLRVISREQVNGEWVVTQTPNVMGKIPVIYYSQKEAEWGVVQSLIERFETKQSNFADTNDYFGSPMVKVTGEVVSLPGKTTSGKVIQLTQGSDASYMSWNSAPESEKLEFELLEKMIYAMTQTPNISFEQMQAIGGDMSGFAIKLMFSDAHMKAENKIELFGEMYQRRLNLIQHVCGTLINVALEKEVPMMVAEPVFTPYLPRNTREDMEILSIARPGKALLSSQTAAEQNPLVESAPVEMERMQADADAEAEQMTRELTGSFNPS